MPQILKREISNQGIIGIWQINEDWQTLLSTLLLRDDELDSVKAYRLDSRKLEFLAVRCLIKEMLHIDPVIDYLPSGKPILVNSDYQLSISHTKGFVAVALSKGKYVGIDIEYPSERIMRVFTRFISEQEALFIPEQNQMEYYTLIWCLKECLYKMIDKQHVIFNHHFVCHPFKMLDEGKIKASYCDNGCEEMSFNYLITEHFYLVFHC